MAWRLCRALWAFGIILASYLLQFGLERAFRRGPERRRPPWLRARRDRVDEANARRLVRGMIRLHGVFIKLGQILSLMGGFLPRVYTKALEPLQDQVPPRPFAALRPAFVRSLGAPPEALFRDLDPEAIAAASLGQVHVGHLADGTKVAVKVLYPDIREVIAVDLKVIRLANRVYRWFVPIERLERIHAQLSDLLRRETDYLHEAEMMRAMAANFADDPLLAFPRPIDERTSREVLTMTFMEGIKITKLDELRAAGVDPDGVASKLVQAFYRMLLSDRLFHADPHPGNFLVEPLPKDDPRSASFGGRLVVLDFGAVSRAADGLVDGLLRILKGFFTKDDADVVGGFRQMGFVARGADDALVERTVRLYFAKLLKVEDRSGGALVRARPEELRKLVSPEVEREELQALLRSFEFPEDWFYVERACVLMFWLAAQVSPTLDAVGTGLPEVMRVVAARAAAQNSG